MGSEKSPAAGGVSAPGLYIHEACTAESADVSADARGLPGVDTVAGVPPVTRVAPYAYWNFAYAASARLRPANVPAVPLVPAWFAVPTPGGRVIGNGPGLPASRSASAESSIAAMLFHTSRMHRNGAGFAAVATNPKIGTPRVSRVSATSNML